MSFNAAVWEDFQRGPIWGAIRATLEDWADDVKNIPYGDFESREERLVEFERCQGRLEAINYLLGLPESFANAHKFEED